MLELKFLTNGPGAGATSW